MLPVPFDGVAVRTLRRYRTSQACPIVIAAGSVVGQPPHCSRSWGPFIGDDDRVSRRLARYCCRRIIVGSLGDRQNRPAASNVSVSVAELFGGCCFQSHTRRSNYRCRVDQGCRSHMAETVPVTGVGRRAARQAGWPVVCDVATAPFAAPASSIRPKPCTSHEALRNEAGMASERSKLR